MQDAGEPATGRHPPAAGHADLEAGSFIEVPVLSEGSLGAAGADDQADGDARDHALQVGASGRGTIDFAFVLLVTRHEHLVAHLLPVARFDHGAYN